MKGSLPNTELTSMRKQGGPISFLMGKNVSKLIQKRKCIWLIKVLDLTKIRKMRTKTAVGCRVSFGGNGL